MEIVAAGNREVETFIESRWTECISPIRTPPTSLIKARVANKSRTCVQAAMIFPSSSFVHPGSRSIQCLMVILIRALLQLAKFRITISSKNIIGYQRRTLCFQQNSTSRNERITLLPHVFGRTPQKSWAQFLPEKESSSACLVECKIQSVSMSQVYNSNHLDKYIFSESKDIVTLLYYCYRKTGWNIYTLMYWVERTSIVTIMVARFIIVRHFLCTSWGKSLVIRKPKVWESAPKVLPVNMEFCIEQGLSRSDWTSSVLNDKQWWTQSSIPYRESSVLIMIGERYNGFSFSGTKRLAIPFKD